MTDVVVLGAGVGGVVASRELKARLPDTDRVVLVDPRDDFLFGLAKLWALDGRRPIADGRRSIRRLERLGIERVRSPVTAIDVEARRVETDDGPVRYDRLVVALGAELVPDAIAGFPEAANLYSPAGIEALHHALGTFAAGQVLVVVGGVPIKCPPAPYEAAMLISSFLARRGVRAACSVDLSTPEPRPLPVAPASCGSGLLGHLQERGVGYHPNKVPVRVDHEAGRVEYADGSALDFDLVAVVPPHRAPAAVRESGLTDESGWIPVDPRTLATRFEDVYAIGDVALVKTPSGKPLPKAGVFAEAEARVVAYNVAAELAGGTAGGRFDGRGHCYLELGDGLATAVEGDFFASPEPLVTLRFASADALREKERFEAERLAAWFGPVP